MRIRSAEFVKSAYSREQWVIHDRFEIALLGRSNVGKSSFFNRLVGRKKLARTSNTPGRTQSLNFYLVNDEIYFVDLPGYGYARVSKRQREEWGTMAETYLAEREQIVLSIQLIDARHPPSELDRQLFEWLEFHGMKSAIVATKADKLSKNALARNIADIRKSMKRKNVIAFSAVTGLGAPEVWKSIQAAIKERRDEAAPDART